MSNTEQCAVLVSSFDGYSDLWEPFFTLFFRYWPDCPFPIYLISNYKKYNDERVITLQVGEDQGWSMNMKKALRKVPSSYFILLHEEFFLEKPVDNNKIVALIDFIRKNEAGCIRLHPAPGPDENWRHNALNLGKVSKEASYRFSLQSAIWDKEVFIKTLGNKKSIYYVEEDGTDRSKKMNDLFLSVREPVVYYNPRSAIIRGEWNPDTVKLCKQEKIKIDLHKRPIKRRRYLRSLFDRIRKSAPAKTIKSTPFFGEIVSRLFWKLFK